MGRVAENTEGCDPPCPPFVRGGGLVGSLRWLARMLIARSARAAEATEVGDPPCPCGDENHAADGERNPAGFVAHSTAGARPPSSGLTPRAL